jgi:hypothetical protein
MALLPVLIFISRKQSNDTLPLVKVHRIIEERITFKDWMFSRIEQQ